MSTDIKYWTESHATGGGRNGVAGLTDGKLTVRMTSPKELGEVPEDATVNAHVGIGPRDDGGFGLKVKLEVSLPGVDKDVAEKIIERGHFICPYSNATQGNIEVETVLK